VRWAVAGYVNPSNTQERSGAGGLILNDLAPWVITALGQRFHFTEEIRDETGMIVQRLDRETRNASLTIGRDVRGTYALAFGGATLGAAAQGWTRALGGDGAVAAAAWAPPDFLLGQLQDRLKTQDIEIDARMQADLIEE